MKCNYGCNQKARYKLSNGKICCESHFSKCPEIRKKNSNGVKKAHKNNPNMNAHINPGQMTGWSKGGYNNSGKRYKIPNEDIFCLGSHISCVDVKKRLIEDGLMEYKCYKCGLFTWFGKKLSLDIHHKNSNTTDNRLENLGFLCPNCHSLTDGYRGKGKNIGKIKVPDDQLIKALNEEKNIRRALIKVGLAPKGANYQRAKKLSAKMETS